MGLFDALKGLVSPGPLEPARRALEGGDVGKLVQALRESRLEKRALLDFLGTSIDRFSSEGDHTRALLCCDAMLALEPRLGFAAFNRAFHLERLGRLEDAIGAYGHAISVDGRDPAPHINRGTLLDGKGELDAAIRDYEEAARLRPDDEMAWYNLGNTLRRMGRFEDALKAFDRALSLDSTSENARQGRFYALAELGRVDEANATFPGRDMVELVHANIVIRYERTRHSNPGMLDDMARIVVEEIAKKDPIGDGITIQMGWPLFTLKERDGRLVVTELDYPRLPQRILRHEVTFSVQTLVMTQGLRAMLGVSAECRCTDLISVDNDALARAELTLHRVEESRDGHSGWVAGPPSRAAAEALYRRGQGFPTGKLAALRPHVIKVLNLPKGYAVKMREHQVTSILDETGKERF